MCFQGAFNTMHVHENDVRVHAPSIRLHEDISLNSSKRWMEHGADVSFEKTRECDGRC
jgi:hypothetical protein